MIDKLRTMIRCCRVTPNSVVFVFFVIEVFLVLSQRYHLFPFNEYKDRALLITLASVGISILFLVLWFAISLILHHQFLFNFRSLSLLVATVAIPCGWLFLEINRECDQWKTAIAIREAGGKVWVKSTPLGRLLRNDSLVLVWYVDLRGTAANDTSLENIGRLQDLRILFLTGTQITDAGLVHLRELTHLRSLALGRTKITDAGLAQIEKLRELDYLWLGETGISDAGLVHLRGLTRLYELGLNGTKVTPDGIRQLDEALPNCQIWWNDKGER
jgi:Leucine-rich repeat (LRR) protein